jgi:hypothetical protein
MKKRKFLIHLLRIISVILVISSLILFGVNIIRRVSLIKNPLIYFIPGILFFSSTIITAFHYYLENKCIEKMHKDDKTDDDMDFYKKSMEMFDNITTYDGKKYKAHTSLSSINKLKENK